MLDFIKRKSVHVRMPCKSEDEPQSGEKYMHIRHAMKDCLLEYRKNSCNSLMETNRPACKWAEDGADELSERWHKRRCPTSVFGPIGNVNGKLRDLLHIPRYLGQLETGRSTGAGANGGWLCRDAAPQSSVFIDNLHTVLRAVFLAAQVSFGGGWRHREVVCAPIGVLPSTKKE